MSQKTTGRYYPSEKAYILAKGRRINKDNTPCIHVSGSIRGMRKQFWGYSCDVVRIGQWIYKVS